MASWVSLLLLRTAHSSRHQPTLLSAHSRDGVNTAGALGAPTANVAKTASVAAVLLSIGVALPTASTSTSTTTSTSLSALIGTSASHISPHCGGLFFVVVVCSQVNGDLACSVWVVATVVSAATIALVGATTIGLHGARAGWYSRRLGIGAILALLVIGAALGSVIVAAVVRRGVLLSSVLGNLSGKSSGSLLQL